MPPLTPQEVLNGSPVSRHDFDNAKWIKLRAMLKFQKLQEKTMSLLTPSGSISRRHSRFSRGKCSHSTTSTLNESPSPEPVDNWSVFSKSFRTGDSSDCDTPSVTATDSSRSNSGPRGRPVRPRPSLSNLRLIKRKSILGWGPRSACLDLSKPEHSTANYSHLGSQYNATSNTSTEFEGTTDAIAQGPSNGEEQPSAYHRKKYEDNYPEISNHDLHPPLVPCCGLHAKHDRIANSHLGSKPQEPGLRSSTTLLAGPMFNPWKDYIRSAADEQSDGSDTVTLVDLTPPNSLDSGMSLASQQSGIRNPYTLGCASLPSEVLNTIPTGNLPSPEPAPQHLGHGGSSSTEQASTESKKSDTNEAPVHIHTIVCDGIIARSLRFFSACLSWICPMFPC